MYLLRDFKLINMLKKGIKKESENCKTKSKEKTKCLFK